MLSPKAHESTRRAVRDIRDAANQATSEVDLAQNIANYIFKNEKDAGSRFLIVDGRPCLFSAIGRRLLELNKNRLWNAHLFAVYGINAQDQLAKFVTQFLDSHCMWSGEKRAVRRWVAFENGVLHVSRYDGDVWRVTGQGVRYENGRIVDDGDDDVPKGHIPIGIGIEPNGSSVIFAEDDGGVALTGVPNVRPSGKLFQLLRGINWAEDTLGHLMPKHQILTTIIWMFAVALPDYFPSKPVLMIEGAPGSGKSALAQTIQAALHGQAQPMVISEDGLRDFWVGLLRSPIAILDNTDDFIRWLPDQICAYTTMGFRRERELHTNVGEVILKPHAFVVVASKNPMSFRRGDVADRCIVLRLERRSAFKTMTKIFAQVQKDRADIIGEWLYYLNRIVAVIKMDLPVPEATHRLADFEAFAYRVGYALNWKPKVIANLMKALHRERLAFASENDVVVEALQVWLADSINEDRPVTVGELFRQLTMIAQSDGKDFLKSPMQLVQRLRSPHVQEKFHISDHDTDRRTGSRVYRILPSLDTIVSSSTKEAN
jgi:hypothetical protein